MSEDSRSGSGKPPAGRGREPEDTAGDTGGEGSVGLVPGQRAIGAVGAVDVVLLAGLSVDADADVELGSGDSGGGSQGPGYTQAPSGFWRRAEDRSGKVRTTQLTNWSATIVADVEHDDGAETQRWFEIELRQGERTARAKVRPADMAHVRTWSLNGLGATAWIAVGNQNQERVLHAVQLQSQHPHRVRIYCHTGWRFIDAVPVYLHAGGGIGAVGAVAHLSVSLPDALGPHRLPDPPTGQKEKMALTVAFGLLDLAPDTVTAAVLGAAWRAPLGHCEVTVFVTGPSGAGKTELTALAQQHFGAAFSARRLPAAWSGTGNSINEICYLAKDALVTVDDFVPKGSQVMRAGLHATAEMVIRAQANVTGRSRMTAEVSLRPSRPPRGTLLATGEDVPSGQSLKARMLVVDLGPQDLDFTALTSAQAAGREGLFATAMAGYVRWLAAHPRRLEEVRARVEALRGDLALSTAHRKTPTLVADVALGWRTVLDYATDCGALSESQAEATWRRVRDALSVAANHQDQQHAQADPVQRFLELVGTALSSGRAHLSAVDGGPPQNATAWGWRAEMSAAQVRPQGCRLGFVDAGDTFLFPVEVMRVVSSFSGTGEEITLGNTAMGKRLHEGGVLLADELGARKTLTVRKQADGKRHAVWRIPTRHFGMEPPS